MRPKSLLAGLVATLTGIAVIAGCSSSGTHTISAHDLATKVIPAPSGYAVDPTPGASGQITPDLFSQVGGVGTASRAGFVAGFKQNYVDSGTEEGIAVTVLEFSSKNDASDYFKATAYKTLSFAAPTYAPAQKLLGAIEASGTKSYEGNYVHGVADSTGRFDFQVVYENAITAAVPVEFSLWEDAEWELLQPGVSLPTTSPTSS
jgi:hypothetical protein